MTPESTDREQQIEAAYNRSRELVRRHGLRRLNQDLLSKMWWTIAETRGATGLSAKESAQLDSLGCLRNEPTRTGSVFGEDTLDLLGVQWALPADTRETYIARCALVGTEPHQHFIPDRIPKAMV